MVRLLPDTLGHHNQNQKGFNPTMVRLLRVSMIAEYCGT